MWVIVERIAKEDQGNGANTIGATSRSDGSGAQQNCSAHRMSTRSEEKAGTAKRCVNGVVTSATSDVANPTAKRDECDEAYAEKHE